MGYKNLPPDAEDQQFNADPTQIQRVESVEKEKPASSKQPEADFTSKSHNNYNKVTPIRQAESYTMDQLKDRFDYDIMMLDHPHQERMIDSVMNIIYDTVNTSEDRVKVQRSFRPKAVVTSRLMKLDKDMIIYVIDKYQARSNRIKYPRAYLLTQLYEAHDQFECDITNQVSHDLYGA